MFVGTPCQVAAMKSLCIQYDNLLLVDIICHGTPSPKIWKEYLEYFRKKEHISNIDMINFRNKRKGWDKSFASCLSAGIEYNMQPYMEMYGEGTIIRPSCYKCIFCDINRISDITLGDFWGIKEFDQEWYDPMRGTSLVLCNTEKGNKILSDIRPSIDSKIYGIDSIPLQMNLKQPTQCPSKREKFWNDLLRKGFKFVVGLYGGDHGIGKIKKRIHKAFIELKSK